MREKTKLAYGVGINDADYQVSQSMTINGRRNNFWLCPFYRTWISMLSRCYSDYSRGHRPTYIGCTVVEEWHLFSAFRAWMISQPWEGMSMDKDILFPGNKVYSPTTCVFVSSRLNAFLTDRGADRGEWPIGVSMDKNSGSFRAICQNPFMRKQDRLGRFSNPNDAHEAWRKRKHELACVYADMQSDPRIAAALRTRYADTKKEYNQ